MKTWRCMSAWLKAPEHGAYARTRCVWGLRPPLSCDVHGGPSGHPCHAVVPVKCCQRGCCGLPWRLEACCTALPAQAADLRKGNLGRWNGGVAPELFTEPSTGPAPPTIFHMRISVCVVTCGICECWGLRNRRGWWGKFVCACVCEYFYEEMLALHLYVLACVAWLSIQKHLYLKRC